MFAGFIDFRNAYNRVDWEKLWGCLESSGIGGRVSAFCSLYWYEQRGQVKVGEEAANLLEWHACGLRQGCILSPLLLSLFSLSINSLVSKLKVAEVAVIDLSTIVCE